MLAVADLAFLLPVVIVIMLPAYCAYDTLRPTCATAVQQAIPWVAVASVTESAGFTSDHHHS